MKWLSWLKESMLEGWLGVAVLIVWFVILVMLLFPETSR